MRCYLETYIHLHVSSRDIVTYYLNFAPSLTEPAMSAGLIKMSIYQLGEAQKILHENLPVTPKE
ncbi:hypothetical protein DWB58_30295 [candidate division KSB1 bacterium]|nr:hypothetical protein [candidate division KSB1 bacterium]